MNLLAQKDRKPAQTRLRNRLKATPKTSSYGTTRRKKRGCLRSPVDKAIANLAYLPVPDRLTVCGLPGALSVNDSVPVRRPFCVGEKLTFTMQLLPAANVLPQAFFGGTAKSAKSPVVAMLEMLSVAVPVLVTVTFFLPVAVVPTRILPQVREVGVRLTMGPPWPVMVSCRLVW